MNVDPMLNKWTPWSSVLGHYTLKCTAVEEPQDTFTMTVTENDKEIERVVVVQKGPSDWKAPFDAAEILRVRHTAKFLAQLRTRRC